MSFLPPTSSIALKEWAVAVNAMLSGELIVILRKGGIHRDDKEFRILHPEFLLFPTYEHQKAELLRPEHHNALERSMAEDDVPGLVTISAWTEVTDVYELREEDALQRISAFHIWTDEYASKRLHWRPKQPLMVALLRVYRLQQPQALPVLDEYNGCKSWVDLGQDVPLGYMTPALTDAEYEGRATEVRKTLAALPGVTTVPVAGKPGI
ncbi:MAG: DUF1802 family protein [SAR202 cluster bacterium]|nr:DUF1802 family protein [SAR202 cluster bacterium]